MAFRDQYAHAREVLRRLQASAEQIVQINMNVMEQIVGPLAALLLLSACNIPDKEREADFARERIMDEAIARDIRDIRERLNKLEANDKVDSKNIGILFKSRDALVKVQDLDYKTNKEAFNILRQNDRVINQNSPQPLGTIED